MNYISVKLFFKKNKQQVQVTSNWQNIYIALDPKRNTWVWNQEWAETAIERSKEVPRV